MFDNTKIGFAATASGTKISTAWLASRSIAVASPLDFLKVVPQLHQFARSRVVYLDANFGLVIGRIELLEELQQDAHRSGLKFIIGRNEKLFPILPNGKDDFQTGIPRSVARMTPSISSDRGLNQVVAVIDSGLARSHPAHPRQKPDHDFKTLKNFDIEVSDVKGHGTYCCGLIAARPVCGEVGIAPLARLVVGQLSGGGTRGEVATTEFLTLLSWAVSTRGAKIVSFSYGAPAAEIQDKSAMCELLKEVRAAGVLVFCAAGNEAGADCVYPAACSSAIAIGGYFLDPVKGPMVREDLSGVSRYPPVGDFLLGPSKGLITTGVSTMKDPCHLIEFSDTSAATAYAAGVAAIYMQLNPNLGADAILAKMASDAIDVADSRDARRKWRGIAFRA